MLGRSLSEGINVVEVEEMYEARLLGDVRDAKTDQAEPSPDKNQSSLVETSFLLFPIALSHRRWP